MSNFYINTTGGGGGGTVNFLAGNTGGNVGPNGSGVIGVVGTGNINVSGNPATNTLTITETQTQISTNYTSVNNAMSPYTVLATDYYISVDSSAGPVTLRFQNAPTTYQLYVVKDRLGTSMTNNISITTVGGGVTVDGLTNYLINEPYEAADLLFNGTSYEVF